MSIGEDMLEVLIGKCIDGEITPAEQAMLERELANNPEAAKLLSDYEQIHDAASLVVGSEVVGAGRSMDDLFESAWRERKNELVRARFAPKKWIGIAAGVAAGFMLGLSLLFIVNQNNTIESVVPVDIDATGVVAANDPAKQIEESVEDMEIPEYKVADNERMIDGVKQPRPLKRVILSATDSDVIRNVDWYNFTDKDGTQWMVQGYRENGLTEAAFHGDI